MINGTKIRASKPRVATKQMRLAAPKVRADIYGTPQHREWSAEIIRRAGGICQGQGCPNPFEPGRLYADHVVELRDGGGFSLPNGQALCATCHGLKTSAVRAVRAARKY